MGYVVARGKVDPNRQVSLLKAYELIHENISEAVCQEVFQTVRWRERQREDKWTLEALAHFWIAVTLDPPPALRTALAQALQKPEEILFPRVEAAPSSFFERCQNLRPDFFAALLHRFVQQVLPQAPQTYANELKALRTRFASVVIFDGSKLEEIAHRLKMLWNDRSVILPGSVVGVYDLFRGVLHGLSFDADAARSEIVWARQILQEGCPGWKLQPNSLVVGDRGYCDLAFFSVLTKNPQGPAWGLVRRRKSLTIRKIGRVRRRRFDGGILQECLVLAGAAQNPHKQILRYIRLQKGKRVLELLTNVLRSSMLTAEQAVLLYRDRWSVERMYLALKEVLNVNRFYAANPNAVAMQLYAAGIVYTALRIAQAQVAQQAQIAPEEISVAKFFPRMAAAVAIWVQKEHTFVQIQEANPRVRLRKPEWRRQAFAHARVGDLLRKKRKGRRRKRRYCAARRKWKSFTRVPGASKLTRK